MRHAGTFDGETIVVATDFPLWFVANTILHEFGHWLIDLLSLVFEWKYDFTMKMENFAVKLIRLLPRKYRDRDLYWKGS
jgi:hypothetical protein